MDLGRELEVDEVAVGVDAAAAGGDLPGLASHGFRGRAGGVHIISGWDVLRPSVPPISAMRRRNGNER